VWKKVKIRWLMFWENFRRFTICLEVCEASFGVRI